MAYKQEPCPLCGRNMTAIETYPGRGELYCGHCDLTIGGNDAKTPEELIALMDSSEHRLLKAGNAQLRELCKTLHRLADESYVPFEDVNPWMDDFAKATCAMRELGIEVD